MANPDYRVIKGLALPVVTSLGSAVPGGRLVKLASDKHVYYTDGVAWDDLTEAGSDLWVDDTFFSGLGTEGSPLILDKAAIMARTLVTPVGADSILISDASDAGALKEALISALPSSSGITEAQSIAFAIALG